MEHTMTICYCEDESAQAKAFAIKIDQWAKNKNIEVHADLFESAEEYLFKAEQNYYDVIFLDISMRGQNGMELARKIREKEKDVILVFVTSDASYVFDGYEVGAYRYLMKPVDHDILKDTVAAALKAWQEDEKRESQVQEYEKICAKLSQGELKKLLDSYQDQPELIPEQLQDGLIYRVKEYISQNLEGDLNRETIAGQVFLNAAYLSRLFHKETGEKLSDYILRLRMERAKDLLTSTSEKVTSIAQRLGYNNDSYFIKTFRGMVGITPYEYRKQAHNSRKKEVTL